MSYLVQYTSDSEGITIGAIGETMVEALGKMAEEFGEGITLLYEHTHEELRLIVESIELSATPREEPADAPESDEDREFREATAVFRGDDVPDPDVPVPPAGDPDPPTPSGSKTDSSAHQRDPKAGGYGVLNDDAPDRADETCTICGTAVTHDRAVASRITTGEVRCSDCTT